MEQTNAVQENKRPTFLTVLCILTFVGVGISIVSSIIGALAVSAASAMLDTATSMANSTGTEMDNVTNAAVTAADSLAKNGMMYYILLIVCALICFVGAFMMWKLKKTGFYVYVVGELVPVILPFIFFGGFGILGGFALVLGLIFPIAFIIMYGLNLKHLK